MAPRYGPPEPLRLGEVIRIEVFEKFFPFNITGGTVRISSANTGYDSGDQTLTFEQNGRSLYYHWNTAGLTSASDYTVSVTLTNTSGQVVNSFDGSGSDSRNADRASTTVSLEKRNYEPHLFAETVDAFCPAPSIPLVFKRVVNSNSGYYPYLGPLGRGWWHSFNLFLSEYTDGRIEFHTGTGVGRSFESKADGTYTASPGDYGQLTRNSNGTFQLREKTGSSMDSDPISAWITLWI